MRSLVWLIAVGVVVLAGCDEAAAPPPLDVPLAEKPAAAPTPQPVNDNPAANQWAITMPDFIEYPAPIYVSRDRVVFDALVRFESAYANVEPYLRPLNKRLRLDWQFLGANTRQMEIALLDAMNENLDTALDQAPKGGGALAFGEQFQLDLINLHALTRELSSAAAGHDVQQSRRYFNQLRVVLGPRPAAQNGATAPAAATRPATAEPATDLKDYDSLFTGNDPRWGDRSKLKVHADVRTAYAFWPAPAGTRTVYLSADPIPRKIDWTVDMKNTPDFDKPQWPQPEIINTRDLHDENEYSKRINALETR